MPNLAPDLKQPPTRLRRESIPNVLTMGRLALTVGVIVSLSFYQHPSGARWALPTAAGLFILAALTDALDGHLARKWRVISDFGRVMDPFADKALVLGSFIVLAGPGFADALGRPVAGVEPWMAVILLARELLVTSIRGVMEASGVPFGANWAGKVKMILQSVAVPLILVLLWIGPSDGMRMPTRNTHIAITSIAWLTVIVTVFSGVPYLRAAMRAGLSTGGSTPMNNRLGLMLTTVGGLGLGPKAPGTFASIPAALLCFALLAFHVSQTTYLIVMIALCASASVLCVALTPWSERRFTRADPPQMALDEVAGQSLAAMLAPVVAFDSVPAAALFVVLAFALFRTLDIAKPGFIDSAQRLPRGWGVLLDDLAAGAGAMAILFVGWNLFV